jgi:hypothetical protein
MLFAALPACPRFPLDRLSRYEAHALAPSRRTILRLEVLRK